jgi:phosphate transport system permease protein
MGANVADMLVEKKDALSGVSPRLRFRLKERAIESLLQLAALTSVAITLGIVGILSYESFQFFSQISIVDFLTDRQ